MNLDAGKTLGPRLHVALQRTTVPLEMASKPMARITEMEAELIREARSAGYSYRALARRFKRSPNTIAHLFNEESRKKYNDYMAQYKYARRVSRAKSILPTQ